MAKRPLAIRPLTRNEINLLKPLFKGMLPYDRIFCDVNTDNLGGELNSITLKGRPLFSTHVICADFAKTIDDDQWIFVHELTHVWQWYHGINKVLGGIAAWHSQFVNGKTYEDAYPYSLRTNTTFMDYNIEQQASIIADYWYIATKSRLPLKNTDANIKVSDYDSVIKDFQSSGPPISPFDVPF
jgi:hypothetical protein